MPEQPAGDGIKGGMEKAKALLTRKVGPLPVWAWGLAGGAVIGAVVLMRGGGLPGTSSLTGGASSAPGGAAGSSGGLGAGIPDIVPPNPGASAVSSPSGASTPGSSPSSTPPGQSTAGELALLQGPDTGGLSTLPPVGQQSGGTDGGLSNPPPAAPGTVLTQPNTGAPLSIMGFFGTAFTPAVTPPGYVAPTSGTIAQRNTSGAGVVAPPMAPNPTAGIARRNTSGAASIPPSPVLSPAAPPAPHVAGIATRQTYVAPAPLASPVPPAQLNAVQSIARSGRRGGTQTL